jgi:hypothetical protein
LPVKAISVTAACGNLMHAHRSIFKNVFRQPDTHSVYIFKVGFPVTFLKSSLQYDSFKKIAMTACSDKAPQYIFYQHTPKAC